VYIFRGSHVECDPRPSGNRAVLEPQRGAGGWGGIRGRGAGARGGTAVPMCGCASRGVRKTLGGGIFLTGSPSCLDPDWCPGRAGCCSGVRAGAGGGWGLPGAVSALGALVLLCVCSGWGSRGAGETLDAWALLEGCFPPVLLSPSLGGAGVRGYGCGLACGV
jgi:hypothetical protein